MHFINLSCYLAASVQIKPTVKLQHIGTQYMVWMVKYRLLYGTILTVAYSKALRGPGSTVLGALSLLSPYLPSPTSLLLPLFPSPSFPSPFPLPLPLSLK